MSENDSNKDRAIDPDATANLRKPKPCNSLEEALSLVAQERMRQDAKWGSDVERIASIPVYPSDGMAATVRCALISASGAKIIEQQLRAQGQENYVSIVYEELCEACEAAESDLRKGNEQQSLKEVTQLAASCIKWMEAILRRMQAAKDAADRE